MEFHCTICNRLVSRKQFRQHRTCTNLDCRFAHRANVRAADREAERRQEERRQRRWGVAMLAASKLMGSEIGSDQILLVPSNDRSFGNLPDKRRRSFRDYLLTQVSQASAMSAGPVVAQPFQATPDPLKGSACGTCRGRCCHGGGTEAYLTAETIRDFMNANPDLRPDEVLACYLERLPNRSYNDSCVFHTKTGCTLTREMRSSTCNEFECSYLTTIDERTVPVDKPVFLVAMSESDDEAVQVQEFRRLASNDPANSGAEPN